MSVGRTRILTSTQTQTLTADCASSSQISRNISTKRTNALKEIIVAKIVNSGLITKIAFTIIARFARVDL